MAGLALGARVRFQECMIKRNRLGAGQGGFGMIAMAGHAVRLGKCLVERSRLLPLRDLHPLRGAQANVGHDMAGRATLG